MIPRISVVVPLYNKRAYVRRSIQSILQQSFQDFEVIVVDDGSTDGSSDVIAEINDPRIRLVVQENQGPSAARYNGVQHARAPIAAFLDADDQWLPDFLAAVLALSDKFPQAGLFATGIRRYVSGGVSVETTLPASSGEPLLVTDYFTRVQGGEFITSSSSAVRLDILKQLGNFTIPDLIGEDADLWARVALRCPFAFDPRVLAVYHSDTAGGSMRRWGTSAPPPPPVTRTLADALARNAIGTWDPSVIRNYIDYRLMRHVDWLLDLQKRDDLVALLDSHQFSSISFYVRKVGLRAAAQILPMRLVRALRFKPARLLSRFGTQRNIKPDSATGVLVTTVERSAVAEPTSAYC